MAANMDGDRFLAYREPAWHRLGTVVMERLRAIAALEGYGFDFTISKEATFLADGTPTGAFSLVREAREDGPKAVIANVGADYAFLQNRDIAGLVDGAGLTDAWGLETMGSLGVGETFFLTLDAGETDVRGDKVHDYFLLTERRDGGHCVEIAFTPVRVVCQNTLTAGLREATVKASVAHVGDVRGELKFRVDVIAACKQARAATVAAFDALAGCRVSDAEIQQIIGAAYPYPTRPKGMDVAEQVLGAVSPDSAVYIAGLGRLQLAGEQYAYAMRRMDDFRQAARDRYLAYNDQTPALARTAWAVWQGVVEVEDYRSGGGADESLLWGPRSKNKAASFQTALRIAK